jgi:hypothetical protein
MCVQSSATMGQNQEKRRDYGILGTFAMGIEFLKLVP